MNAKTIATSCGAAVMFSLTGATGMAPACAETLFNVTNLVSDGAVPAKVVDPSLINPWGIAMSPSSPFWISDNNSGLATLYSVSPSNSLVSKKGLTVTIPAAFGSTSNPTGQVFNNGTGFLVNGKPATFLFDSEDGAISGWNGGTSATIVISHPSMGTGGSVYKGLAIDPTDSFLFATDFRNGDIEEYNSAWTQVNAGLFVDPNLAAGYAPFNLKVINGDLYVTYALRDAAKHDDVAGPGHGFVDVFNLNGTFDKRLISGGALNSPWGLQIAPSSFGSFAGDLLVGNFGDGMIDAYNATTGAFIDVLRGPNDKPIDVTDLRALSLGNG